MTRRRKQETAQMLAGAIAEHVKRDPVGVLHRVTLAVRVLRGEPLATVLEESSELGTKIGRVANRLRDLEAEGLKQ